MTDTIDLSADYHGHATDYACDQDRRWFGEHPDQATYTRSAVEHEFCQFFPACVELVGEVRVVSVADGLRTRSPIGYFVAAVER
jgi:hypothetical protein